jgi:hypothetical protein
MIKDKKMFSVSNISDTINSLSTGCVWTGSRDDNRTYQEGEIAYDQSDNSMYVYNNNTWIQLSTMDVSEPEEITPDLPDHIQAQIRLMYPGYDIVLRKNC